MLNPHLNRRPPTRRARLATIAAALAFTAGIAGFHAAAQTFGRVSGLLVDATNRPIAGATLVMTNVADQSKHEVRSDAGGRFDFVGLPQGDYRLEAWAQGFAPFRETLTVAGSPLQRPVVLQVGSLTETVTVWGPREAPGSPRSFVEAPAVDSSGCVARAAGGVIEQPMKIRDVKPDYPAALFESGVGARIVLEARIGTDGAIRDVRAVAPVQPDFERAAIEAVREWRFTQTRLNCVPIEVNMTVHVNFAPRP